MNRKDLQALNLVGPTKENLVLDPLAVQQPTIHIVYKFKNVNIVL